MRNEWKHRQKLLNAGELKPDRIESLKKLLELGEKVKEKAGRKKHMVLPLLRLHHVRGERKALLRA